MEVILWLAVFLAGAFIGSFLNVCIVRIPLKKSMANPPSQCISCRQRLNLLDIIPILSYIALRGECRFCGSKIPLFYIVVEVLTGLLFVLAVAKYGFTISALRTAVLFSLLVPISLIDIKHKIIPDKITFTGILLGLPLIFESKDIFLSGMTGFFIGGGLLFLIALLSRGGMGGGDIKLAAMMGIFLGWQKLLLALFLAFGAGGLTAVLLLFLGIKKMKEAMPFGPFLAMGSIIAALAGDNLILFYLKYYL